MARGWTDRDDRFVAAALEPAQWIPALEELAVATGSDRAQLIGFGADYGVDFNWANGDLSIIDAFAPVPPNLNFRVRANMAFPDAAIIDERHYAQTIPTLESDAYVDLCREWGILHGCQTNLRDGADGLIGLALLRSEATGPTDADTRAMFDDARRDAAAAVALQIALEKEGYRLIAGTFEAMQAACFVMDRTLKVRAMSPDGEALLREGALTLAEGRLSASEPRAARDIAAALHAMAVDEARARRVLIAAMPDARPERPVVSLQFHRLPRREWAMGFAPFAVAVATRPGTVREEDGSGIRAAFGLTGTETAIALMLAGGQNRETIRVARGVSKETMRSHLRALFAKLGVRRETDAIRLLSELLK
ncbi:helix-turn-helix transcriptional regulator [Sphingomonas sp. LT1P40]|uniref:helix-turn-helix transcriptional regulator n=1 Tax=Alteristakelama amylovorans TaxID=3096166 RepID=UPI002FCBD0A7